MRIVVLSCSDLGIEVARRLSEIEAVEVTLVTTPYRSPRRTTWQKMRYVYRMQGPTGFLKIVASKIRSHAASRRSQSSRVEPRPDVARISRLHFKDFHDPECLAAIRELQPDLGVLAGTYILREQVFSIPVQGCINFHSGEAPRYRGAAPAFWELYNGERRVGITIHRVTAAVDAGNVLIQELFPLDPAPRKGDPLKYLERYRREVLRPNGVRLLCEAVRQILDGSVVESPQNNSFAATYRSPDLVAIKELRRRVRMRRHKLLPRRLKSILGWLALKTGVYRTFLRKKAIVVLFHRVDEAFPNDPFGCGKSKFVFFCDVFARYFRVVSIEALLTKIDRGEDIGCHLAITFDDGYLDNFSTASPLLQERNLPACFFVATGYLGTERVPGWDRDIGVRPAWMKWDQVRALHQSGFEIGAHTINHVNLGDVASFERFGAEPLPQDWGVEVGPDEAAFEITESKRQLERELGVDVRLFSHPFGRHENMTERNRDVIRKSGFACCFSAYGGAVHHASSLYDLPRMPIFRWHISPFHFVFEAMRA